MLSQAQRSAILELHAQGVSKREIARVLKICRLTVRKVLRSNSSEVPALLACRESRTVPATDPGTAAQLQGESGAGAGRTGGQGANSVVLGADRLLPPSWHRATADGGGGALPLRTRRGAATRHLAARGQLGGKRRKVQTASAVLCYSRMLFFQLYPPSSASTARSS